MMSPVTSYTRTQVYLEPADHRSLKRLAAARGESMTNLVREAIARYVATEANDDLPTIDELADELYADPLYEGIPAGRGGFVARMRARATSRSSDRTDIDPLDQRLGHALWDEHDRQRHAWLQRNPDSGPSERSS